MAGKKIQISMTSFADFVVCDSLGQLAKVRQIRRQYESEYFPSKHFWSRFIEGVESILNQGGSPRDLVEVYEKAKDNRPKPYASACEGFKKFWGRHELELAGTPKQATWDHERLRVRLNPEWLLTIDGKPMVIKLHVKEKLPFNQRLANPLLYMLDQRFGPSVGGPAVGILDVHRGKLWTPSRSNQDLDLVLHMQAAAFIIGWDVLEQGQAAA
jgi:hypothetical protein